jgi:hypothetical protein
VIEGIASRQATDLLGPGGGLERAIPHYEDRAAARVKYRTALARRGR